MSTPAVSAGTISEVTVNGRMSSYQLLFELGRAGVSDFTEAQVLMRDAILEGKHKFTCSSHSYVLSYVAAGAGPEFWELRRDA